MNHKTSHLGKPSVRDCCKYLNLGVSDTKSVLVRNLVEKLMSEIGHVTESASCFIRQFWRGSRCGQEASASASCRFDAKRARRTAELVI